MKTDELTGAALDWAVSHCVEWSRKFPIMPFKVLPYSTDWAQGGPIIERECIEISCLHVTGWTPDTWTARHPQRTHARGKTPLIAAMRCYVSFKLGDEVELPEELK